MILFHFISGIFRVFLAVGAVFLLFVIGFILS